MAISAIKSNIKKIFFCKKIYYDVVVHIPNFQLSAKSFLFFCAFFLHFYGVLFLWTPYIYCLSQCQHHGPAAEKDIFTGQGALCYDTTSLLNRLLRQLGFQSHIIEGFYAGNPAAQHLAVVVTDVERQGDAFHIDVGSFVPLSQALDISHIVRPDEPTTAGWRDDYAPLESSDVGFRYQVANAL